MLGRVPMSLVVAAVIGAGVMSGCGSDDDGPTTSAPSASPTTGSPRAEQTQTPKVTTPRPKDPLAPATIKPVGREGKRPHPTMTAAPASFKREVSYGDGVRLEVTDIRHGHVTGEGPGVVKGPTTTFSLALKNGSSRPLELNSVVVTAVYGRPERIASPIYLDKSQDFAGTTRPGSTTNAVYTFGISMARSAHVTIHVDFDEVHTAAVFSGPAR